MEDRVLFKGFPTSLMVTSLIFVYLFFYLTYVAYRSSNLNYFEFYVISLLPVLLIVSVRGRNLFDEWGFNLNHAPLYILIGRLLIISFIGFLLGYGIFKLSHMTFSLFGFHLFPFDIAWLQLTVPSSPAFLTILDCLVIAGFEEIIRISGTLGFANYFFKKGFKTENAVVAGVVLSSALFILCHWYSWGGVNTFQLILGSVVVIVMTSIGWVLRVKDIWGPLSFMQFTIWGPIVAHFIYDFLEFQSLSIGLGIIPSLLTVFGV